MKIGEITYRLPDKNVAHRVNICNAQELKYDELDLNELEGFIMSPFDSSEPTLLFSISEELSVIEVKNKSTKLFEAYNYEDAARESYIALVVKAKREIAKGDLSKVVVASQIQVDLKRSPMDLFNGLCEAYPHAFCYLVNYKGMYWVGASPEMLCRYKKGSGQTVALAGTQEKNKKEWGTKEKEEQEFIKTYLEDQFNELNNFSYSKGNTITLRAGDIEHISSIYSFQCSKSTLSQLVQNLHPTPAVCGYPKEESKKFILKNEGFERSFYSGFLGVHNEHSTDLFVNLRCGQIMGDKLVLFAGAGITKDSNPQLEWEEIKKKWNTFLNL